jgi:glycosyltransferase involved in cell wall biosynthesis
VRHGTYDRLRPEAILPPRLLDVRTAALAAWVCVWRPLRVARTLGGLHRAAGLNPWAHAKLLAVAPKALAAAWRLRRRGVAHVHAHFANQMADCAAIAATVAGIPFSFTAHAYDVYQTIPRQRNDTLGWKLAHAARAFAVSAFAADLMRGRAPGARVETAYVGIPLAVFRPEPPQPDDGTLRLLAVARLCEKKGLDTLVDAGARLAARGVPFELDVLGDGPLRATLEAQVERLGLGDRVRFRGAVPQEEVARRLRECHAFVLPCRRDRNGDMDGIPTVFMEAMATGRPVVSTAVSGIPELVRDGETGLVVSPDDPDALAAALARLAGDPELRRRLGTAARALVERQHDERTNAAALIARLAVSASPA